LAGKALMTASVVFFSIFEAGFLDVTEAINGIVDKCGSQKQNKEHEFMFTIILPNNTCQASD
jgi:hypothetical protein